MAAAATSVGYRFGHFDLQPHERRLLAAGTSAHLGPHAFDLLVALVERNGHLVTKDALLQRVWARFRNVFADLISTPHAERMMTRPEQSRGRMFARIALGILLTLSISLGWATPLGPEGEPGHRHPGKFIWFDLATDDPEGARAFYAAVFDWRFQAIDKAPAAYTLIDDAGTKVGGMFKQSRPPGAAVGSRWLALMSVADPAKAVQYVREHGGKVLLAPVTVPGRGTHAVFRDPQGAVFGVLAASGGDPPDDPVIDGDMFWLDLFTPDPPRAADFYAGLADYQVSEAETASGHTRRILASESIARAGIVTLPAGKAAPGWLPYILVDDVSATLERVRRAGGKVLVQPRADLLDGNVAVIADPNGGAVGVVNWTERVDAKRSR